MHTVSCTSGTWGLIIFDMAALETVITNGRAAYEAAFLYGGGIANCEIQNCVRQPSSQKWCRPIYGDVFSNFAQVNSLVNIFQLCRTIYSKIHGVRIHQCFHGDLYYHFGSQTLLLSAMPVRYAVFTLAMLANQNKLVISPLVRSRT